MATKLKEGPQVVSLQQDEYGYRTIKAKYLVSTDDRNDSVYNALFNTPGMPLPGSIWQWRNDVDPDVFCTQEVDVALKVQDDYVWYEVTRTFSNKPVNRCPVDLVGNPLLEPAKVSLRTAKFTEEAAYDRFNLPILSSSGELMRGPAVEFDDNRFSVRIEQNVAPINLPLLYSFKDTVNDRSIWGFPYRSVKVSSITGDKHFYGPQITTGTGTGTLSRCQIYFARTIELDVFIRRDPTDPLNPNKSVSGHDRDIPDEGRKVLRGRWETRKGNANYGRWVLADMGLTFPLPADFHPTEDQLVEYSDFKGNTVRAQLNGQALPANVEVANPIPPFGFQIIDAGPQARIHVEKYPEADLIGRLGLPSSLEE